MLPRNRTNQVWLAQAKTWDYRPFCRGIDLRRRLNKPALGRMFTASLFDNKSILSEVLLKKQLLQALSACKVASTPTLTGSLSGIPNMFNLTGKDEIKITLPILFCFFAVYLDFFTGLCQHQKSGLFQ